MNTLEQVMKATDVELANAYKVTLNAASAASNYLLWMKWYNDVKGAMGAASDFIENENDLKGLEKILKAIKKMA